MSFGAAGRCTSQAMEFSKLGAVELGNQVVERRTLTTSSLPPVQVFLGVRIQDTSRKFSFHFGIF
jgi:hypothetical protein